MKVDVLVAEIGSTTTVVNAFKDLDSDNPVFWAQGQAPTSVLDGDVRIGLQGAIGDLCRKMNIDSLEYDEMLATSSAAGGLKMTVHGLVYDMTAKAAKEAALGAGGIIHDITVGKLRRSDIARIREINPNLILIAGGVDYGERDTAIFWIELKGRFILIQYFALRNDDGEYKGVMEVSQDATEIRKLEGQRRLLNWE